MLSVDIRNNICGYSIWSINVRNSKEIILMFHWFKFIPTRFWSKLLKMWPFFVTYLRFIARTHKQVSGNFQCRLVFDMNIYTHDVPVLVYISQKSVTDMLPFTVNHQHVALIFWNFSILPIELSQEEEERQWFSIKLKIYVYLDQW